MTTGVEPSWVWGIGFIAFAFGLAIGVSVGYMTLGSRRRTQELQEKYDLLQRELDDYRGQVGQHFMRTSELVQNMTQSYREVYDHLARGSQALCKEPLKTPQLDIPETPPLNPESEPDELSDQQPGGYSDAETDGLEETGSDDYLGDAPRVPELEPETEPASASPRTQ